MHPLTNIGLIVATVGAGIVAVGNLTGLGPLSGLGLLIIMAGAFNAIIGLMAGSVAKRNAKREDKP